MTPKSPAYYTKEPFKRALQKSPSKEPFKRALQKRPSKETFKRVLQKSPSKETCTRPKTILQSIVQRYVVLPVHDNDSGKLFTNNDLFASVLVANSALFKK